jgi:hypothetical protein
LEEESVVESGQEAPAVDATNDVGGEQPSAQTEEHNEALPAVVPDIAPLENPITTSLGMIVDQSTLQDLVDPSTLQDPDIDDNPESVDADSEAVVAALIESGVLGQAEDNIDHAESLVFPVPAMQDAMTEVTYFQYSISPFY